MIANKAARAAMAKQIQEHRHDERGDSAASEEKRVRKATPSQTTAKTSAAGQCRPASTPR